MHTNNLCLLSANSLAVNVPCCKLTIGVYMMRVKLSRALVNRVLLFLPLLVAFRVCLYLLDEGINGAQVEKSLRKWMPPPKPCVIFEFSLFFLHGTLLRNFQSN